MKHPFRFPRLLHATLFGGAIAATTTLSLLSPALSPSVQASLSDSPKAILDEAWQIVNREYVDTSFNNVDWHTVRQELLSRNYTSQEEAYTALREALERLNDPYTRFMDPRQYEQLTSQTSGELSGVGIRLQALEESGALAVVEPIPNSPASSAGIRAGDRILAIDGKSTEGMSVEDASSLIRGEVGTRITLRILREGEDAFDLPLVRARIELPTVRYSLQQDGNTRIGYIRLNEFSAHAASQMRRAISDLTEQGAEAFVLDLRGNPGGLLQASIDIARMWLGSGSIVRTVDRVGASEEITANHTAITDLPLAVLVDGSSASSSEILTGALMDNERATIVGTQTFGKALVQSVHSLSDGSGLAVTIAHYYTPDGTDISHRGIAPDVPIELTEAQREQLSATPTLIGTNSDPQYSAAVSALREDIIANRANPQASRRPNLEAQQNETQQSLR
ncbi:S41 family peptidase [Oscillatoria sp. FACHB-1407]|uniref:carboxyl-terminal processing protease CtpB n=1 Tax=Oscillatoria sp. FACHB-1407 TaxID=2692847 RepID=UPI001689876C|nr:carboxyl-terminal processing protease CtpB [Oscillatoria sp. FACHB-1407]MBD2461762.1 S41 family peptidase [Oscillatoria sp. FACHB-1407]